MSKFISLKKGSSSVLFWSIISAAFIGPGTVTTCTKAGAQFGYALLWALIFSTIATILLQEIAARISMATGKNLGEIIAIKFHQRKGIGLPVILFLAVAFGCAAYQSGNILGAVAGLRLMASVPSYIFTLAVVGICYVLLVKGSVKQIAYVMGFLVLIMGCVFCYVCFQMDISIRDLIKGLIPTVPPSSGSLIIGLVGTTIVPYNLFLGSGIEKDQSLKEMRFGIGIAIAIGGIISMAILLGGTGVQGTFSYQAVSDTIGAKSGKLGSLFFALGLFAAGLSSAITAPLAAAICGQSLLGQGNPEKWNKNGKYFKSTWIVVLIFGGMFGILNVQPIPAIIAAQGINGLLLPMVCVAIYLAIRDQNQLPEQFRHREWLNNVYLVIIWVTCFLGLYNIQKALLKIVPIQTFTENKVIWISVLLSAALILMLHQDHTFSGTKPKKKTG